MLTVLAVADYNVLYIFFQPREQYTLLNLQNVSCQQHFPFLSVNENVNDCVILGTLHIIGDFEINPSWLVMCMNSFHSSIELQEQFPDLLMSTSPLMSSGDIKDSNLTCLISAGLLGVLKPVIAQDVMLTRAVTYSVLVSLSYFRSLYS